MFRLSFVTRQLLAAAAFAGLLAGAPSAQEHAHADGEGADAQTRYRLFVGDHAEGVVRAIELADGADAGTFRIDQTPALYASSSGRTIFAVQGEAGKVAVIGTGLSLEDHGDHADLHVEDAKLLPVTLEGTTPAHVVDSSGTLAAFDDGTGDVQIFPEASLHDGTFSPRRLSSGAAHHGLAAPMGDHTVVSVPGDTPEAPRVGLKVLDREGRQVGSTVACPGVHGQDQSARVFAFGCRDGIVLATPGAGAAPPVLEHVSTAALGEGNVSTLRGGRAMKFFLANYGPKAVVVIEPGAGEMFRKVDLPTRRVDFALDPAEPRNAFVLTEDGWLHRLNVLTAAIERSARVTEPYSMDGHWRDPRPRLAVAGDHVAITDPRAGLVRLVSADTLEEERALPVEGTPYTILAVGGSGAAH